MLSWKSRFFMLLYRIATVIIITFMGALVFREYTGYQPYLSLAIIVIAAMTSLVSNSAPYAILILFLIMWQVQLNASTGILLGAAVLIALAALRSWNAVFTLIFLLLLTSKYEEGGFIATSLMLTLNSISKPSIAVPFNVLFTLSVIIFTALRAGLGGGYTNVGLYIVPLDNTSIKNAFIPGFISGFGMNVNEEISFLVNLFQVHGVLIANQILFSAVAGYICSKTSSTKSHWRGLLGGAASAVILSAGSVASAVTASSEPLSLELYSGFIVATAVITYFFVQVYDFLKKYNVTLTQLARLLEENGVSIEERVKVAGLDEVKEEIFNSVILPFKKKWLAKKYSLGLPKSIVIYGPKGCGKSSLLAMIYRELGDKAVYLDCSSLPSNLDRAMAKIRNIFKIALETAPFVVLLDSFDKLPLNNEEFAGRLARHVDRALREGVVTVIVLDNASSLNSCFFSIIPVDKMIYVGLPGFKDRMEILKAYLGKMPLSRDVDFEELARLTDGMTGAEITAVCKEAARRAAGKAASMGVKRPVTMEDIVETIASLKHKKQTVSLPFKAVPMTDEARTAIIGEIAYYLTAGKPISVLLFGPKGCGKTRLVNLIVVNLDVEAIILDFKGGNGLRRETLEKVFESASMKNSMIILENLDYAGSEVIDLVSAELEKIKDRKNGMVVIATCRDPAAIQGMLSLFNKKIYLPLPNKRLRARIFMEELGNLPIGSDVDFNKLAEYSEGFTIGDIVSACRQVVDKYKLYTSTAGPKPLTMSDILTVLTSASPSIDRDDLDRYKVIIEELTNRSAAVELLEGK